MSAVTAHSDFGAQENKVCHCYHCFPIFLHEVMGPESRQIGSGQTRDGKNECRYSRNQQTKMDWNG